MHSLTIISTTFELKKDGEQIAQLLLSEKLIACAQISAPITSYYFWNDTITQSTEFTLTMKTTVSLCNKVESRLVELHPYELPEIIIHTVTQGSKEYMKWVQNEVRE